MSRAVALVLALVAVAAGSDGLSVHAGPRAQSAPGTAPAVSPDAPRADWSTRDAIAELVRLSTNDEHEAAVRKGRELLGLVELRGRWQADEDGFAAELRRSLNVATPDPAGDPAGGAAGGAAGAAKGREAPELSALLDGLAADFARYDESLSAELHYAVGVALLRAGDALDVEVGREAESAFRVAAAQAGPGELRLDALYDAGLVHLLEGERRRAEIPELGGTPPAPQMAPPGAPAAQGEQPPDPLALARAAYERARDAFVLRLRADWRDGDTRANLELIQRRLHELDEIERQREEEQSDEPPESDQQESSEDSEQQEESEEQPDGEQQPGEDEQDPSEQQEPEQSDEEGEQPEEQQPPEPEPGEEEDAPETPPTQANEQHLTREEIMRLLDKLQEIEEEAARVRAAALDRRRVPVEKDW